jgi:large subunit ribosomal protein L14e
MTERNVLHKPLVVVVYRDYFTTTTIEKKVVCLGFLVYLMLCLNMDCWFNGFLGDTENMPAIEVGRICVKQLGRENGKKCVIIDVMDKSFVLVTGPKKVTGVKRRRVNINHVMPLLDKIEVKRGASDEEVAQALEAAGKLKDMTQPVKTA